MNALTYSIPSDPNAPSLVGRDRELGMLRAMLDAARHGHGGLVLIGGEAGIGKTALAEEICTDAREQGARVLVGRCYDFTETPPYGPWIEAMHRAPHGIGDSPLPGLVASQGGAGTPVSQAALFAAARDFFATLTERQPLVLLLDDMHWADRASLELLRFLAREFAALPLLLLVTYRADELTRRHPLYSLLPLLEHEARAIRLDLRRLNAEALGSLVTRRYALATEDATRLAAWLLARAEGNAFFTNQLLRALEDQGILYETSTGWALEHLVAVGLPDSLRQVLDTRLARLGEAARQQLALAAVIGQAVPLPLWAAVAETDEDGLLDTIEQATDAHLLAESPDGESVYFAHALIREALYEGLLALRRRRLHRRVGEILAAPNALGSWISDADAVAYHFRQAGDPRAADWLEQAGERAQRAYAWVIAAERYEAALALLDARGEAPARRGWLAFRLGALRRFSDPSRGLGDAEEAMHLANEADDPLLAGAATFLAGLLLSGHLGQRNRGLPRLESGLAALLSLPEEARVPPGAGEAIDPAPRQGTLAAQFALTGRYAESLALGERYLGEITPPKTADWLGGNPYGDALAGVGLTYFAMGRPEESRATFARARETFRTTGYHRQVWQAVLAEMDVVVAYEADSPSRLQPLLTEATEVRARSQAVGSVELPFEQRPYPLLIAGRWTEARQTAEMMLRTRTFHSLACAALAMLEREQGRNRQAAALVNEFWPDGPTTPPGTHDYLPALVLQRLAAMLAIDARNPGQAKAWLEAHDRWLAWSGGILGLAEGHLCWAAYHHAAGEIAQARQHAEQALILAGNPRQPLALLAAHRILGELDITEEHSTEAARHLVESQALADACAAPYERALTLLAQADLHLATGDRDGARLVLNDARTILMSLEARPALARTETLAARLDAPASASAAAALPFGLSTREAEVLRLVAQGMTDAQVADQLFLSLYTVKAHLRSVYNKTGAPSRTAAAHLAREHGLA